MSYHDNFCSSFYKNNILMDHIEKTMEQEILEIPPLNNEDIDFFIDSLVGGLAFLQRKRLRHGNLRLSTIYIVNTPSGVKLFKVGDKELMGYEDLYQTAFRHSGRDAAKMKYVYLSPEQLAALRTKEREPGYDPVKSDVFTLGFILVHLCLWRPLDEFYDQRKLVLQENFFVTLWQELQTRGCPAYMRELLVMMLNVNPQTRADFVQLDTFLDSLEQFRGKRVQNYLTPDRISSIQRSAEMLSGTQAVAPSQAQQPPQTPQPQSQPPPEQVSRVVDLNADQFTDRSRMLYQPRLQQQQQSLQQQPDSEK